MDANTERLLTEWKTEIDEINTLYHQSRAARAEWTNAYENDASESEQEQLKEKMVELENEFQRRDYSLRIRAEKTIGKGKPLGDFGEAIYKMRKGKS